MQGDRLFIGVFPTGLSYADRRQEENGDYKVVAHLSFADLTLDIYEPASVLLQDVVIHAARVQARRGEKYAISASGQTVTLGHEIVIGGGPKAES